MAQEICGLIRLTDLGLSVDLKMVAVSSRYLEGDIRELKFKAKIDQTSTNSSRPLTIKDDFEAIESLVDDHFTVSMYDSYITGTTADVDYIRKHDDDHILVRVVTRIVTDKIRGKVIDDQNRIVVFELEDVPSVF